ncbi:hypothetical protein EJB05_14765, partial [Eragrostis curvula]
MGTGAQKVTVTFDPSVTVVTEELCQELLRLPGPEICMRIYLYRDGEKISGTPVFIYNIRHMNALVDPVRDADPADAAAVLLLAAPRLTGWLAFGFSEALEGARAAGAIELPCFEKAELICLHFRIGYLGLALPPSGVFAKHAVLHFQNIRFKGPCNLGDAVSSVRCPSLKFLYVFRAQGVSNLDIRSESLRILHLETLEGLQQLTVVAPRLRYLGVSNSFMGRRPTVDISVPVLVMLQWYDAYDPSSVQLGELAWLQELRTFGDLKYESPGYPFNGEVVMLLQSFRKIPMVSLFIYYPPCIENGLVTPRHAGPLGLARAALAAHAAPVLRELDVFSVNANPGDAAAVLLLAAPRLTGWLLFKNMAWGEAGAAAAGTIKLPCFEKAEGIYLHLGYLGLALPPSGVFAKLARLHFDNVRFHGPCNLGDAISSSRCPSLQHLHVVHAQGVSNLHIHTESLLLLELNALEGLQQLTVVAPMLRDLGVFHCFIGRQPVADFSVPVLETLKWVDEYDPRSVQWGELAQLRELRTLGDLRTEFPEYPLNRDLVRDKHANYGYGQCPYYVLKASDVDMDANSQQNELKRGEVNTQYLAEVLTFLPYIDNLELGISTLGHGVGPYIFHFLSISSGIRKLQLRIRGDVKGKSVCSPGCDCHQPQDSDTEELIIDSLQEVDIYFDPLVTVSEELCQELLGLSHPETCMKIYLYRDGTRVIDTDPGDAAAVLLLAAPRLAGSLVFDNKALGKDGTAPSGAIELPCFDKAKGIYLRLGYLGLVLPPSGVFTKLAVLDLENVRFHGPCNLGDAVSSARSPSLQYLHVIDVEGVSHLDIHSESLLTLELNALEGLQKLTVVAPRLRFLCVSNSFMGRQPVADLSVPVLDTLKWVDEYDPSSANTQYLAEVLTFLPDIDNLQLRISTLGHGVGPYLFHFLSISSGIRKLQLWIWGHSKGKSVCSPGCDCHQPQDSETEELIIDSLQEVYIYQLRGAGHEIVFLKRLLRCASALKTITVDFDPLVTVKEELCQELLGLSKPETCMKIYLYRDGAKVMYAPVS